MRSKTSVPTFVKWAGGKTQLLSQFRPLLPKRIDRYFEPFLGSGAVFFYIKARYKPKDVVLSDVNEELINCFRAVRDRPDALIEALEAHKAAHGKEHYYRMRGKPTGGMTGLERASRFIYLNKTCFNGLYRVNSNGQFNVPMGSYKNPGIVMEERIRQASSLLRGTQLRVMSFERILSMAGAGDFVYFDPPYLPISKTASFTSYTRDSFSEQDQRRLAEVFRQLDRRGCLLMLSNSYHPFMRTLYSGHRIETVKAGRVICCDPSKRGKIREMVVLNFRPSVEQWSAQAESDSENTPSSVRRPQRRSLADLRRFCHNRKNVVLA